MKSPSRALSVVVLSVLLISLLAACNNPIGPRSFSDSRQPQAPAATVGAPQTNTHSAIDAGPDSQGDEIERSLDDLTNELNSTDTVDDLK